MKLKKYLILVLACFSLIAVGCGKKKQNNGSTSTQELKKDAALKTFFVHGDPMEVVYGSRFNTTSVIEESKIENFNSFSLEGISQFTEKDEIVEKADLGSIETGNEAVEDDLTKIKENNIYKFEKRGNEYIYTGPKKIELTFEENEGKLEIKSFEIEGASYAVTAIHYSLKEDGNAFSILVTTNEDVSGKILLAFTFTRRSFQRVITKTDKKYKYLYGAGVVVPWNNKEELELNICGGLISSKLIEIYKKSINEWDGALKNRLTITTKHLLDYPPFSDLNNHCIYTVPDYQTLPSARRMNVATTYTVGDIYLGKLIDSDVLVWVKENAKTGQLLENQPSLEKSVAHEVGHFLGLDHQFAKEIPSIMSYAGVDLVTDYDIEAIAELYPLNYQPSTIKYQPSVQYQPVIPLNSWEYK